MTRPDATSQRTTQRAGDACGGLRRAWAGILCLLFAALIGLAPQTAQAQDRGFEGSYVTPFPEGDVYRAFVIGDSLAAGLHGVLYQTLGRDGRVRVNRTRWSLNSLTRRSWRKKLDALIADLKSDKTHLAVVMVGAWDARNMTNANGRRVVVGSDEWRQEYTRRIDTLMKEIKRAKAALYWVGLPGMRRWKTNDAVRAMNEVIRERAYLNGQRFIDVYASFASDQGNYTDYGPDLSGKVRLLRERDGIHLTFAGNQKLAHFVEREIKRDLTQAKAERSIPLAGSETEQARVRAKTSSAPEDSTLVGWRASVDEAKKKAAAEGATRNQLAGGLFMHGATGREQVEDHGRVNLKTVDPTGREQIVALDIVRPAIPASVVALVTRKQSPDRLNAMGDTLVDQIAGGLNIMSSVTPPNDALGGASRKLSPAQTPFFRVLVKGERVSPQKGRADDFAWPRPPPPPMPRIVKAKPQSEDDVGTGGVPLPPISPFRPRT